MFNKLISNLPFNPSLIDQVAFYGRRLKRESSIRRVGFIFIVLAMAVQLFGSFTPSKQVGASANANNLLPNGISSLPDAVKDCQSNYDGYGSILAYYAISCSDVASASTISLSSTDTSYGGTLYSAGREPFKCLQDQFPVNINTSTTIYWRTLHSWDTCNGNSGSSTYQVLRFKNDNGLTFFIIYTCGNLVSVGPPSPPPKPNITINKTTIPGSPVAYSIVKPGTVLGYRTYFNNTGSGGAADVTVTDALPANTTYSSMGGGTSSHSFHSTPSSPFLGQPVSQFAEWVENSMPGGASNYYVDLYLKVNSNTPNGTNICNTAYVRAINVTPVKSNQVCVKVEQAAPPPKTTPPPKSPPPVVCTAAVCLTFSKTAKNVTQNISNANGTTAQAGDTIQYTLDTKNTGKATVDAYTIQEPLSDVMVYANLQNTGGGTLGKNDMLTWPAINIGPGKTIEKQFTVTVKNPIPQNAPNPADPAEYDMTMTNVYGNTVNINLPKSPAQIAQQAALSLPNTGPGTGVFIGFGITLIVGYFFARARLLAKETELVKSDFNSGGSN